MKRLFLLTLLFTYQESKTLVCHLPPHGHDLLVELAALPAHLSHGDFIGPCEAPCPSEYGCE